MTPIALKRLAWKFNWFRQSELDGALLLGRMIGTVSDRDLAGRLTRHCAEEAEHSRLWAGVIAGLDLPHVRIFRSYQSFYLSHTGPPGSLLEVLSFTQVFERRVHRRFRAESRNEATPAVARAAFARMIEDEKGHLSWVADWLATQPEAARVVRRYERVDALVFQTLQPFEDSLWELPGLGEETGAREVTPLNTHPTSTTPR
jgi:hypothetical protein